MTPIAAGLAFVLLLLFVFGILLLTPRVRQGRTVRFRRLPGYTAAREAIARAAEQGRTTHIAVGPGTIADSTSGTAETLAGLHLLGRAAAQCAASATPLLASAGGALTFPLAENVVCASYAEVGRSDEAPIAGAVRPTTIEGGAQGVRMLAHQDAMAYAAGAADVVANEGVSNAVLVGAWGPEYLLVGAAQAAAGAHTVAGATSPAALATMTLASDHTLMGEEIYASGAYLDNNPAHQASLLAQDLVRLLLIGLIVLGALLATAGMDISGLLLGGAR